MPKLVSKLNMPIKNAKIFTVISFIFLCHIQMVLFADLSELENQVQNELRLLNFPPKKIKRDSKWEGILDVAIIGAGMSGQTVAFALQREGVDAICLFDQAQEGKEGPWLTFALMKTLQSSKTQMGPAYWIPSLTYEAYHRARFGNESWLELEKVPTKNWGEYLIWIRKTLYLPIKNGYKLIKIDPCGDYFSLYFENGEEVCARKIVFANGREAMGGHHIPNFFKSLPQHCWSFANQPIDFSFFKEKRIGIIGAGSSAFDVGATAAKTGAKEVVLFSRRAAFERNKQTDLYFTSFYRHFYDMEESLHWDFMTHILDSGGLPPSEETLAAFQETHAKLEMGICVTNAQYIDHEIVLETSKATYRFDHLINATGYQVDLTQCLYLQPFVSSIYLWGDRAYHPDSRLISFPDLGPHFEFLGDLTFLKDLYCFNYAAFMSFATAVGDMPGVSYGASRLAEGIAKDLFLSDTKRFLELWKKAPLW